MRVLIAAAILLLLQPLANAGELVREFSGSKSTTTQAFEVDGAWLLDWRLDADYESLVALDITLIDASTGAHVGRVLHTKRKGNGLKLFKQGGRYQLRISTTLGRWRIKIQSISDDEIERYTPRRPPEPVPGLIR
ncbi:MAG: hypothetical protein QNJ19_16660 [Woeseiaceae bacterium]|nr:hypothetical protein [Woeseiaceae bacterium]